MNEQDQLKLFNQVLTKEALAIELAINNLSSDEVIGAANLIVNTKGKVIFISLGKGSYISDKLAASYASMGIPSFFVHASELFHGDFGRIEEDDTIILITHSGETKEVVAAAQELKKRNNKLIAITKTSESSLSKLAHYKLNYGIFEEADHLNLAPTSSTTVALAMGDALMVLVSKLKNYRRENFAKNHPGGSLGKMLGK